ncbi:hypothetical protein P9112_009345 [Eukaryota sp. TZLM1-RC]
MACQMDATCHIDRPIVEEILSCEISDDLKSKTILLFITQSRVIKSNDFIWLLQFSSLVTIEEIKSISSKTDFGELNQEGFNNILNFGINHSLTDLITKVIDNYHFQSLPEVFEIPVDFLSNLTLSNVVNGNKEVWLEKVLRASCNQGNIREVSRRLLGREVGFKGLDVGVYCQADLWLNDIVSKLKEGFNQNWNHVEISIGKIQIANNFNELNGFDVVVVETERMKWPAAFLNQILESGKGLVLFNGVPANVFNYSCFEGGRIDYFKPGHPRSQLPMTPTLSNDPLLTNVSSFSSNSARINTKLTSGTLVATINNGIPLIAKKIVGSARLVEFGYFCSSNDSNCGWSWSSSTDGHLLLANAVAWCGNCV